MRSIGPEPVLVVGRGRLGRALTAALRAAGVSVRLVSARAARGVTARGASRVLIAAADPWIAEVSARLAPMLPPRAVVLHAAGGRGPAELAACRDAGASVGVMHPLASFASPRRAPPLEGTTFVVDGDPAARRVARAIARCVGARAVASPMHGPRYHAAAALAANGAVALAAAAVEVLAREGMPRRDAERAIGGLLHTVAANVEALGVPAALTGPIARGDAAAVAAHRAALAGAAPGALAAYDGVAPAILSVARRAGLAPAAARSIARALRGDATAPR